MRGLGCVFYPRGAAIPFGICGLFFLEGTVNVSYAVMAKKRFRATRGLRKLGVSFVERFEPNQQWLWRQREKRRTTMREYVIRFSDDATMPERIEARATECEITPEQLINRAITQYMGDYGLKPLPEGYEANSLRDLFEAKGLLKPLPK